MEDLGYNTDVYVLDASRHGVAQTRKRVFIVGDLKAAPPLHIRMQPGRPPSAKGILACRTKYASRPLYSPGRATATIARAERGMEALGKGTPFLIVYYGSDGAGGWQSLDRPLRTITTLDRFGLVTWEGSTPMLRMLQVDELMAAMGFEGGYDLEGIGQRRDRIRLLGNGVAPPVMRAIISALTADVGLESSVALPGDYEPFARRGRQMSLRIAAE
jgi:DNA (cytosine-5)-methyltransferase 1